MWVLCKDSRRSDLLKISFGKSTLTIVIYTMCKKKKKKKQGFQDFFHGGMKLVEL